MTDWNDQAIVLRMGYFREADLWLKILCRSSGIQTVFAFGGARSVHRFCGCLDVFNTLDCHIQSSRNGKYLNLQEASLISGPESLRSDWRRMGVAANCIRFLEIMAQDTDESAGHFLFLENLRMVLDQFERVSSMLPLFFRLAIASIGGYAPALSDCGFCGNKIYGKGYFDVVEGKIFCHSCAAKERRMHNAIAISETGLKLLNSIQFNLPEKWPVYEPERVDRMSCALLIDKFLEYHVGVTLGKYGFQRCA